MFNLAIKIGSIKTRKHFILSLIALPLLIIFVWSLWGRYMNPDFNSFVKACRDVPIGINQERLNEFMQKYENLSIKKDIANNRTNNKIAFRLSEEYSGDICFVSFSNDGLVVSSEFSPD